MASALSSWTSRSPPRPLLRSGSARWAICPLRCHRALVCSTSSSKREAMPVRHCRARPSDQKRRKIGVAGDVAGIEHGQARRDVLAGHLSASGTVRTLWSRRMLASHNGIPERSATWVTMSRGILSCTRIRSRSEYGSSSPRPSPPVATMANPLVGVMPISVAFVVSQNSCRSSSASRSAAESS